MSSKEKLLTVGQAAERWGTSVRSRVGSSRSVASPSFVSAVMSASRSVRSRP